MSDQNPLEKPVVVGEDGELLQPDMTVDPEVYSEYVATYVRRDPLLFRVRENVRENGCGYLLITPFLIFALFVLIDLFFGSTTGQDMKILELVGIVGYSAVIYWTTHRDTRP